LQYYIIESSPFHRRLQSEKLAFCEKVHQFESLHELKTKIGSFNGIVFSNELFDAFPVDVVTKKDDTFYEIRVSLNENDDLFEVVEPCEKKELTDWLKKRKIEMVEDQRMEIPLAMDQFIIEIGNWIEKGIVITVDYGYVTEQWSKPERKDGSLRGYFNHQLINNPLQRPGEMDLTTHIHFDSLIESAKVADLKLEGFYRQDEFLLKAGILRYLQDHYDPNPFSEISKQNRAVRSLISDQSISSSFHTILQSKGIKFNADDFLLKLDELK
jgi:SAM-dependent MidA family methyltransferase